MRKVNKIANSIMELKRVIGDSLGTNPEIKIGLDFETYDRLMMESYSVGQHGSSFRPHEIHQGSLAGCPIVPWIKEKF